MSRIALAIVAGFAPLMAAPDQWRALVEPETAVVLTLERSPADSAIDGPGSPEWQDYTLSISRRSEASWVYWRYHSRSEPALAWTGILSAKSDGEFLGVRLGGHAADWIVMLVLVNLKTREALLYKVGAGPFLRLENFTGNSVHMTKPNRIEVKGVEGEIHRLEFSGRQVFLDGTPLPPWRPPFEGPHWEKIVMADLPFGTVLKNEPPLQNPSDTVAPAKTAPPPKK